MDGECTGGCVLCSWRLRPGLESDKVGFELNRMVLAYSKLIRLLGKIHRALSPPNY